MPLEQAFNKRTRAWVKYEKYGKRTKIVNVKQKNPAVPFKGVKIRKKKWLPSLKQYKSLTDSLHLSHKCKILFKFCNS